MLRELYPNLCDFQLLEAQVWKQETVLGRGHCDAGAVSWSSELDASRNEEVGPSLGELSRNGTSLDK